LPLPARAKRETADLFYSEDENEKEVHPRSDHFSRDLGDGENVGASGDAAAASKAVRCVRRVLHPSYRPETSRRVVLGLPPPEDQRLA